MCTSKQKPFLSARWENLVLITYCIRPEILKPFLPHELKPDTVNNQAFVSLVAFDFFDTKVKGIKIPFYVNFPEINLRFYARANDKRGVVFIRELVPKFFIAHTANILYKENYRKVKMKSSAEINEMIHVKHKIYFGGKIYSITVEGENKPYLPSKDSLEHFFKEHEWGFGQLKKGGTVIYRVEHPYWNIYPVKNYFFDFDFGKIYGNEWEFLNSLKPFNITLAAGSAVKVFPPKKLDSGTYI